MSVDLTVELFIEDTWTDITTYVRQDPGVEITFGVTQENASADPASARMVVNNSDGRFTPRNSAGAYYPWLTRNTPLRVSVDPGGGNVVRFIGAVSEFPVRWDPSEADWWVPLSAYGPLRRLARSNVLDSTLTAGLQSIIAANSDATGYWPVEDSAGSTSIAPGMTGIAAGGFTGSPIFGEVEPGIMSKPIATWNGAVGTFVPAAGSSTAFTAGFLVTIPDSGGDLTGGEELARFNVTGTALSWRFLYSTSNNGSIIMQVISSAGAEIEAQAGLGDLNGATTFIKLEAANNGADVDYVVDSYPGGLIVETILGATVGAPTIAHVGGGTIGLPDGVGVGHVIMGDTNNLLNTPLDAALAAYAGESIQDRVTRLEAQTGQPMSITAVDEYVEQGAQPEGSLLDALRSMEAADVGGIVYDSLNEVNTVHVIPRRARYNDQQAGLALDYASGHLSPPLEPTEDDSQLRNDVTVTRLYGSSARATLTSGALSSADYPDGVGLYPYAVTLATYQDSQLPYVADWLLALGTVDETRWPRITIDLVKNPSLVAGFDALRPGHPVTVENLPAISGVSEVYLHCIGWTETITGTRRLVTLNCVPGSIWGDPDNGGVFILDDAVFGELDVNRLGL